MEEDLLSKFKKIRDTAKLSNEELDFHRSEIIRFIEKEPIAPQHKKIFSPFNFILTKHLLASSFVILLLFSSGVTLGAETSLPNDYLYSLKTKVTEPLLVFFTPTAKGKTELRVALVNKRLQEFSRVSQNNETLNPEDKADFVAQLSSQVKDAHDSISQLAEDENSSDALQETNDLQSILLAQDTIVEKIDTANSTDNATKDVTSIINASIEATADLSDDISQNLQTSNDEIELDKALSEQKEEIANSIDNIDKEKAEASEDTTGIDIVNKTFIDSKLSKIKMILEDADKKLAEGDKYGALELYNQADQKLGELELLIESDNNQEDLNTGIESPDNTENPKSL
jgi:hypothetical protein